MIAIKFYYRFFLCFLKIRFPSEIFSFNCNNFEYILFLLLHFCRVCCSYTFAHSLCCAAIFEIIYEVIASNTWWSKDRIVCQFFFLIRAIYFVQFYDHFTFLSFLCFLKIEFQSESFFFNCNNFEYTLFLFLHFCRVIINLVIKLWG